MSVPWLGIQKIAIVPTFNTQFDGPAPPEWDNLVMRRVLYDPDPSSGIARCAPTSTRCRMGRRFSTCVSFRMHSRTGQALLKRRGNLCPPVTAVHKFFALFPGPTAMLIG